MVLLGAGNYEIFNGVRNNKRLFALMGPNRRRDSSIVGGREFINSGIRWSLRRRSTLSLAGSDAIGNSWRGAGYTAVFFGS